MRVELTVVRARERAAGEPEAATGRLPERAAVALLALFDESVAAMFAFAVVELAGVLAF